MKVHISTTIDVDARAWAEEFHMERAEVRDDVKYYFAALCDSWLHERLGLAARGPSLEDVEDEFARRREGIEP